MTALPSVRATCRNATRRNRAKPSAPRSIRGMELAITCAVHAVVAGAVALAFGWQGPGEEGRKPSQQPLLLVLPRHDTRPARPNAAHAATSPKPVPLAQGLTAPHPSVIAPATGPIRETPAPIPAEGERAPPAQDAQTYRRAIMARLETQRFYPDAALSLNWQGSGAVLFRIERSGRLLEAALATSTGHAALDKAALGIVQHAAPFPAIPDSLPDELAITMPVTFLIDHSHPLGGQP